MGLDLAVLDDHGRVLRVATLGVEEHSKLMEIVAAAGSQLLRRLHDYYADAEFAGDELPALLAEADVVARRHDLDDGVRSFMEEFTPVVRLAIKECRPLSVLAD